MSVPTARDARDTDIAIYKTFIRVVSTFQGDDQASEEALNAALDAVAEEFGEEPDWPVEVFLGIADPSFTYSDGITIDFNEEIAA